MKHGHTPLKESTTTVLSKLLNNTLEKSLVSLDVIRTESQSSAESRTVLKDLAIFFVLPLATFPKQQQSREVSQSLISLSASVTNSQK